MKLSAQGYTVRDQIAQDLWGTLAAMRSFGLNYIEVGGTYGVPTREFKDGVDKLGLKISANHASIDQLTTDIDAVIEETLALDTQCLVLSSVNKARWEQGWATVAAELNPIGAKFRDAGIKFAYHNHAFEFALENGRPGLDILFENADPSAVYAQIDTYWVAYGGADPAEYIRKLGNRVTQCHFKDGKLGEGEPHYLEVGQGDLDWDDILAACNDSGVEFGSIELDHCPREPLESVRMSVEFLRSHSISE